MRNHTNKKLVLDISQSQLPYEPSSWPWSSILMHIYIYIYRYKGGVT